MFLARKIWCIADVSNVSPSSEQNEGSAWGKDINALGKSVRGQTT